MSRLLASAWVGIAPSPGSLTDFGKKAQAGIKKAMRGVSAEATVTADTKPAVASVDSLKIKLKEFSRTVAEARLTADSKQADATLAKMAVKLTKLNATVANPKITLEGVAKAEAEILALDVSFDKLRHNASDNLGPSLSGLGSTLGHVSTGFFGVVAAGIALSPVIATLGLGLGGLGLAALGVSKNTALMGRVMAPLKKTFAGFTASLQPTVLADFAGAARLAGNVLGDLQPVAKTTGTALGGLLSTIDTEFKSRQWQTFFQWLADNAGPDVKLVGDAFISLLNVLPGLLMALQPIAEELIGLTIDFTNLVGAVLNFGKSSDAVSQSVGTNTGLFGFLAEAISNVTSVLHPGGVAAGAYAKVIGKIPGNMSTFSEETKRLNKSLDASKLAMDAAKPSATNLAADLRILSSSTADAASQATALNLAWDILVGNFATRETAILNAKNAVQVFADAIRNSGAGSLAAQQAFEGAVTAIGQVTAADIAAHVPASQMYNDILAQYNALKKKGPLNKQERDQLDAIRKFLDITATSTQGWTGATKAAAAALENNFIPQLVQMHALTPKTKTDVENFTNSIINTGTKSTATHDARAKLIADLVASGVSSKTAKAYVDSLQKSIDALHGKNVKITMNGTGVVTITGDVIKQSHGGGSGNLAGGLAAGGFISGGVAGRDSVAAMLMPGELVVPTRMVNAGAVDHLRGRLPGFSQGGVVSGNLTPGFVTGMYSTFQNRMTSAMIGAMRAAVAAAEATARAAAAATSGAPGSLGGPISAGAAQAQAYARSRLSAYGWSASQMGPLINLWNGESGWNRLARNGASGAYGIPQALPASKMGAAANPPTSSAAAQINWGLGYIRSVYGSPSTAYSDWLGRSPHWYAAGGMVPGMAGGGVTPAERAGQTWLNAWRSRRGGGFGAAWGPIVLNQQIPNMQAALGRATTLSHASGLSAGKHRFWAAAAADERKRLAVLKRELSVERTWRGQLGATDVTLSREISAAGNLNSLRGNVRSWRAQMAAHKYTISQISRMLGYSDTYIKAHPPAPKVPPIHHLFGGDVGERIPAFLASIMSPFKMGGMIKSYDRGGWMPTGLSVSYNGTGRPERVGGGDVNVTFEIGSTGNPAFDDVMLMWMRKTARIKGGTGPGSVERAFGSR
jgi:hypothetical protein